MVIGVGVDRFKELLESDEFGEGGMDEDSALEKLGINDVDPMVEGTSYTTALGVAGKEGVIEMVNRILVKRRSKPDADVQTGG